MFKTLSPLIEIERGKQYPLSLEITHIGVKNGKLRFCKCLSPENNGKSFKSCSHWRYFLVPDGSTGVAFPYFRNRQGGWEYGQPKFLNKN